ncbi:MAG: ABC transporter permease [Deltaproteobacteria bacterium]|nr:ABC transporter permease [Deltaproteobacteria bacterium]
MHITIKGEFGKSSYGRTGLFLLAALMALAVFAPVVAPYDPNHQTRLSFEPPSWCHILGTNHVGQDNWSRLVYGARTSLLVGFGVALLATTISATVGGTCGLKGGLYDAVMMRLADALLILPAVVILITISAYVKPRIYLLIILISSLSWPGGARIVRSQTLSLKERPHIWAARSFGASTRYILHRHIIPDLGPVLVVEFIHAFKRGVFMEAGLAFLGIGDPMVVSWGTIMKNAVDYSYMKVWACWLIPAGLALSFAILSLTLIGHTLEPVMEPRLREQARA